MDTSAALSPIAEQWTTEISDGETPPSKKNPKIKSKKSKEKEVKSVQTQINGNDILSTPKSAMKKRNLATPLSLLKNPFSTPMSSAKKVKIALNLNRSQDHVEYHQSLVSSPGIPYDADKKPSKPLLKTRGSLPGAINPFYKYKK